MANHFVRDGGEDAASIGINSAGCIAFVHSVSTPPHQACVRNKQFTRSFTARVLGWRRTAVPSRRWWNYCYRHLLAGTRAFGFVRVGDSVKVWYFRQAVIRQIAERAETDPKRVSLHSKTRCCRHVMNTHGNCIRYVTPGKQPSTFTNSRGTACPTADKSLLRSQVAEGTPVLHQAKSRLRSQITVETPTRKRRHRHTQDMVRLPLAPRPQIPGKAGG